MHLTEENSQSRLHAEKPLLTVKSTAFVVVVLFFHLYIIDCTITFSKLTELIRSNFHIAFVFHTISYTEQKANST